MLFEERLSNRSGHRRLLLPGFQAQNCTTPTPRSTSTSGRISAHLTGSPYWQYPRDTETCRPAPLMPARRPADELRERYPAFPLHPWVVSCRAPQWAGSLGWSTVRSAHRTHPGRCRCQTRLAIPGPAGRPDIHPARRPRRTVQPAEYHVVQLTEPHRSGQPRASLTPAGQGTPTPRTGPYSKIATD
jgi:hypothetical protein